MVRVPLENLFPVLRSNRHFNQIFLTEKGSQSEQTVRQTVFKEESTFQLTVGDITKPLHSEHIPANLMGCLIGMIDPFDVTKGKISVFVGSKLNLLWESQTNGLSHKTMCQKHRNASTLTSLQQLFSLLITVKKS